MSLGKGQSSIGRKFSVIKLMGDSKKPWLFCQGHYHSWEKEKMKDDWNYFWIILSDHRNCFLGGKILILTRPEQREDNNFAIQREVIQKSEEE